METSNIMLVDARELLAAHEIQTDICIIGAGAAGITLARELNGSRFSVCLLEGGGTDKESASQSLYEGDATGSLLKPGNAYLTSSRLRYLGGSTNHWAGYVRPLDPIDFESRQWVPHSGWPFDYAHLEPFYHRAAQVCQIAPFDYDPGKRFTVREFPLLYDGLTETNADVITKIFHFSPPTRFGKVYREELIASRNVSLYLHANVLELQANRQGNGIDTLTCCDVFGKPFFVRAKRFVLAAGGIESPRLMLASNSVHREGIGNAHDLVGRYFMEHPHLYAGMLVTWATQQQMDVYAWRNKELMSGSPVQGLFATTERFQRQNHTIGFSAQFMPLSERRLKQAPAQFFGKLGFSALDLDRHGMRHAKDDAATTYASLWCRTEQAPNPASRVRLADETDRFGIPKVRLEWKTSELDIRNIRLSMHALGRAVGMAGVGRAKSDIDETLEWPKVARGGNHHMGTLRMHDDPSKGVVDRYCKVHGVDNLYVASSAVFPTGGFANPTFTIVALTIRLADYLKTDVNGIGFT